MHYKTIVLELLEQRPEIHEQLRSQRMLLLTMDRLALELKASHEKWKEQFAQARSGSDAGQISSEALELALEELTSRLSSEPPTESDALSLDGAMAALRRHTPPV